jgi:hypothetical protein
MNNYYNLRQTENSISYEPYLYNRPNAAGYLLLGTVLIMLGVGLTTAGLWADGMGVGLMLGGIIIIKGCYDLLIRNKIRLEFNKHEDALYRTTPLGKRKKVALSNIYDIINVHENGSYSYELTRKDRAGAKSIPVTTFITERSRSRPEIAFLENELVPLLVAFLQLRRR